MKANLPKEAIGALLYCLQQVTPALNANDLKEPILAMIQNGQPLMAQMGPKSRPPAGSAAPGTGPPVGPVRPTPRPPPPTLMPLPNVHPDPLSGLTNQLSDRLNLGTAPVDRSVR